MSQATAAVGPFTLLEREDEVASLEALLDAVKCGVGRVVVIEGGEGLGKSRLLDTLRYVAESRDVLVLSARGAESEQGFPFGVVRQLFEPVTSRAPDAGSPALLRGAASLAAPLLRRADPSAGAVSDSAFARLHGLYWLTASLCEHEPLALLIDDAHDSDEPSLRFVSYLQRRLVDLPVLLVIARRPQEHRPEDNRLAEIAADASTVTVRLRPLSREGCRVLLHRVWPDGVDDAFCSACHEATGGNPFLLTELIEELLRQGLAPTAAQAQRVADVRPASVARMLLVRLGRLPADAVTLAQAIAVFGEGAELRHAARLAQLSLAKATELAVVLADADLIAHERTLRFAHPLVRASVYGELSPWTASRMHRRAAGLLAESAESIDRIASHLVLADPAGDPWAAAVLRRAAIAALARGAPEAAAAYLDRALAEPVPDRERADVLLELGRAEIRAGRAGGTARLRECLALAQGPHPVAEAARELAGALSFAGNAAEAEAVLNQAIEQIREAEPDLALELAGQLGAHAFLDPPVAARAGPRLDALGEIQGTGAGARSARTAQAFYRSRTAVTAEQAGRVLGEALLARRTTGGEPDYDGPLYLLVIGLLSVDRFEHVEGWLERARIDAGARGCVVHFGLVCTWHAYLSLRRGDVAAAEEDAKRATELLAIDGWREARAFPLAFLVETLIERGALDEAARQLEEAGAAGPLPAGTGEEAVLAARARLLLARGRPRDALADLEELQAREHACGLVNPLARRHRGQAALALAALGDASGARAMAAEDLRLARAWGAARDVGVALRSAALVDVWETRLQLLRDSVAVLEGSPARLELARALADLGGALRRANRRAESRAPLRRALDIAHRCGAHALVQQAQEELAATGARPRTVVLTGVESLTASERRVAQLAAKSLSNPEIAQALFVTRKTVEKHLSNVYTKLGVRSRDELPEALEK